MLALLGTVAVLLTACARTTPPAAQTGPATTTGSSPRAGALDVCTDFTVLALSSDAAIDRGPANARERAAQQYGTAQLAARLGGEGRDQSWTALAAHHARVQVNTTPVGDDPPPPKDGQIGIGVQATRTAVAADGWRQDLPSTIAYCSLVMTAEQGWRVDAVTFSDTSTTAGAPR